MTMLYIRDETYRRLAERAAAENATVEEYIETLLERDSTPRRDHPLTPAERRQALDKLIATIEEEAESYPPGFVADDSRESIYEGRGEQDSNWLRETLT